MHYYNDGADGFIWEPLYRKKIGLTPCEQQIVMSAAFRRLGRIAHYGAAARILPMTQTRYTHSLGVFTLAVHFRPEDWALRLAALLHDVGHLPFSHSAERALGLDHHDLAAQVMERGGLNAILADCGFDPDAIRALALGETPSPLACGPGALSLDHLDAWLRDTETAGMGYRLAPHELLKGLALAEDGSVTTDDPAVATEIVRRISADHRLFCRPRCIGLDALVTQIFAQAHPDVDALLDLGDEEALHLAAAQVPHLVDLLRNRPWDVAVREDDGGPGLLFAVTKLYDGQIKLHGRPAVEVLPEARAVRQSLESLRRSYRVTFPA